MTSSAAAGRCCTPARQRTSGPGEPLGVPTLKITPPHSVPSADCIVDSDGSLTRWLEKKGASVVVVRPDGFVYAGAKQDQPLPPPPAGFKS